MDDSDPGDSDENLNMRLISSAGSVAERNSVKTLVDLSEDGTTDTTHKPVLYNNWVDAVTGWVMHKDEVRHFVEKKRKAKRNNFEERERFTPPGYLDYSSGHTQKLGQGQSDEYWPGVSVPEWKAGVEQTTYRYIPNNGKYRAMKFSKDKPQFQPKIRKAVYDKPVMLSVEQRELQREIQRDLRREFEQCNEKKTELKQPSPEATLSFVTLQESKNNKNRSPVKESKLQKQTSQHSLESPDLPAISFPLVGKSVSENFIEKFSTKISALEDEIKKDLRLMQKGSEHEIHNGKLLRGKQTEYRGKEAMRASPRTETLTQETFSVKSIVKGQFEYKEFHPALSRVHQSPFMENVPKNSMDQLTYTMSSGDVITIPVLTNQGAFIPNAAKGLDREFSFLDREKIKLTKKQNLGSTNHVPDKKLLESSLMTSKYGSDKPAKKSAELQKAKNRKGTKPKRSKNVTKDNTLEEQLKTKLVLDAKNCHTAPVVPNDSDYEQDDFDSEIPLKQSGLLPVISGKRIQVSVGAHKC